MAKAEDVDAPNGGGPVSYVHTPFSLLPNAIPKSEFDRAVDLAPLLSLLVDAIAADREWLRSTLRPVLSSDPFTARLVGLMDACPPQPQVARLGLLRSDYMVDGPSRRLLQVEVNTIAASFGCASAKASALHAYLLHRFTTGTAVAGASAEGPFVGSAATAEDPTAAAVASALATLATTYDAVAGSGDSGGAAADDLGLVKGEGFDEFGVTLGAASALTAKLPPNPAIERLAGAIAAAHRLYLAQRTRAGSGSAAGPASRPAVVAFVVQGGERNVVDQRLLELALWGEGVLVRRLTLAQIANQGVSTGSRILRGGG
jgi:glutathione synthase